MKCYQVKKGKCRDFKTDNLINQTEKRHRKKIYKIKNPKNSVSLIQFVQHFQKRQYK